MFHCCHSWFIANIRTRGGTGTGNYPVPAGYCTTGITRTLPGITLRYGRIRILGICLDFCDSQLYLTQRNAKWEFVLRPSLMHDTLVSHVSGNCPLDPSWGRADGNLQRDGLISHLTWRITMFVSTDEAITQRDMLLLSQRLLMLLFLKRNLDIC